MSLYIEAMLENKNYNVKWRERIDIAGPNEVMTFIEKKFRRDEVVKGVAPKEVKNYFENIYNQERYWWVGINLLYVKDISKNKIKNFKVNIYNQFIGGISPAIKTEIDDVGDLICQDLIDKVGKEKVKIEREEWGPPVIY